MLKMATNYFIVKNDRTCCGAHIYSSFISFCGRAKRNSTPVLRFFEHAALYSVN
jgi:hypothetical protein